MAIKIINGEKTYFNLNAKPSTDGKVWNEHKGDFLTPKQNAIYEDRLAKENWQREYSSSVLQKAATLAKDTGISFVVFIGGFASDAFSNLDHAKHKARVVSAHHKKGVVRIRPIPRDRLL